MFDKVIVLASITTDDAFTTLSEYDRQLERRIVANFAFEGIVEELPQIEGDLRIFCNCEHFTSLCMVIIKGPSYPEQFSYTKGSVITIQSLQ